MFGVAAGSGAVGAVVLAFTLFAIGPKIIPAEKINNKPTSTKAIVKITVEKVRCKMPFMLSINKDNEEDVNYCLSGSFSGYVRPVVGFSLQPVYTEQKLDGKLIVIKNASKAIAMSGLNISPG